MKAILHAALYLALLPAVVSAQPMKSPPREILLSCITTPGKALELAFTPAPVATFHYRFGPAHAPELALSIPATEVEAFAPWRGVGRSITSGLTLHHGDYSYTVWTNYDRLAEDVSPITGGVEVKQGGETIVGLRCADHPEPMISSAFGIEDAMTAAGLIFDEDRDRWLRP